MRGVSGSEEMLKSWKGAHALNAEAIRLTCELHRLYGELQAVYFRESALLDEIVPLEAELSKLLGLDEDRDD